MKLLESFTKFKRVQSTLNKSSSDASKSEKVTFTKESRSQKLGKYFLKLINSKIQLSLVMVEVANDGWSEFKMCVADRANNELTMSILN